MGRLRFIKARRRFVRWLKITARSTLAPFFERGALLQLLAYPLFLWLVFLARGYGAMSDEAFLSWAAAQALIYAVPVFLIVNAVTAVFRVMREEKEEGQWFGTSFNYNDPPLLLKARVTDADNDKLVPFKVAQAEKGGSVELQIEISGLEKQRIKAIVLEEKMRHIPTPWGTLPRGPLFSLAWTPKNKTFYLATHSETLNPSIVAVRLVSWNTR